MMSTGLEPTAPAATTSEKPVHNHRLPASSPIFHHIPHPHAPTNVNLIFEAERKAGDFNQQVATRMTRLFQAMPTFWLIMAWIVLWIGANATILRFDPLPWPLLLTLASVPQLPLMIVIMVGQGLLGRKQELQAEEQFNTTQKTYHDLCQVMDHLSSQDAELLRQTKMLVHLLTASGLSAEQLASFQDGVDLQSTATVQTSASPLALKASAQG